MGWAFAMNRHAFRAFAAGAVAPVRPSVGEVTRIMTSHTTTTGGRATPAGATAPAGTRASRRGEAVGDARRRQIVEAARELYEERGMSRTTVKDVTERIGISRSLFYHYFPDKDAVTDAVLDTYVDDFLELVRGWNAERERHNVRKALTDCIRICRMGVFDHDSFRANLATNENASLYLRFLSRSTEAIARYITITTARDYQAEHGLPIDHVYETFYMLIIGIVGFMRSHPDASDELLEDLVAQTLRLDLGQAGRRVSATCEAPGEPSGEAPVGARPEAGLAAASDDPR